MLLRTACTGGYIITCVRNLHFSSPKKPKQLQKKAEFKWTLVPNGVTLYKRKSPSGKLGKIQESLNEKLEKLLMDKKNAPPTGEVVDMLHDMFTKNKYISRKMMAYLSMYFGRKGELMKCVEVQELTKALKLMSHEPFYDDLSLNGLLTGAQNCPDKELAVEHLRNYHKMIRQGQFRVSAVGRETLLRAMLKQGMNEEVLSFMSFMLARDPERTDNFSGDSPSVYLGILVQISAEADGPDKANGLLREMCGRLPTQDMGSDSYALLGTLLIIADTPPYTKFLKEFLRVKTFSDINPLYHTYSTLNTEVCVLYETLINVAMSRRAHKPFMMVGGPEGLWHKLLMLNEADHQAHITYIVALCKIHGIPVDKAFMRHIVLQYLNHETAEREWLDYSKFIEWYNVTSAHAVDPWVWMAIIRHTKHDQLTLVERDVIRAGAMTPVLTKELKNRKSITKKKKAIGQKQSAKPKRKLKIGQEVNL